MTGRIVYLPWIERHMLKAEPEARFVFGDNIARWGLAGQARAMRGEPNAIGIATKRAPGLYPEDFFSDDSPTDEFVLLKDIQAVIDALNEDRTVYVPKDGLGAGLSQLPARAPRLYALLYAAFASFPGEKCPWPVVEQAVAS